ncbi:MAG: HIRAN domain-containing protein [Muribaculaceae bacterium]|nr:HIRAN domain-containing protein [Muribaculaceae bacterium]
MTSIHMRDPRYWEPHFEYQSVFFKECAVAGTCFHIEADDDIWNELEEGTEIALVRDRNNKHDSNAVAVVLADDYDGDSDDFDFDFILGYIPRNQNEELARMLDAGFGEKISAKITTYKNYGNVNKRLRITIYLQSNKPLIVMPDFLRATTLDLREFRDMVEELNRKGTCYMRFGGFYDEPKIKPIEGEKVVAFYQDNNRDYIMYMLRVFVTGDKCVEYLDNPEDIHMIDDCCPYILTNVCGPVFVKPDDVVYDEIGHLCSDELNPMEYLNEVMSFRLNHIFEKVLLWPLNRNNIDMDPSIDDPKDAE